MKIGRILRIIFGNFKSDFEEPIDYSKLIPSKIRCDVCNKKMKGHHLEDKNKGWQSAQRYMESVWICPDCIKK